MILFSESSWSDMPKYALPLRLFSESPELFEHFGISPWEKMEPGRNICGGTVWEKLWVWVHEELDWLILLEERNTLYTYALTDIDEFRKSIGTKTLGIICERLHIPRGSGKRRWVNSQEWQTNFNANIFLEIEKPALSAKEIFSLQQKISVGIARTLESYVKYERIAIQYPFHYLLNGGKVAGHLLQSRRTAERTILRIGIGINSDFAPELPRNDELVQYLYGTPTALGLYPAQWVELYHRLKSNIQASISMESCHIPYLDLLTLWAGDTARIFKDNGTIQLGTPVYHGVVYEITEEGNLVGENGKVFGTEHHVKTV